ncbi:siroheme synthase CysG [Roseicyclus sp. F158]|uniref:Siroheme synthase CysG n=1 Tax=Tropicimonas omnivorans TaxID=3075590 RepID=A0ABU3DE39_9RHOB|nr:siroheme synthase CysG [Roseicyclus sp. F158]MDT0681982.1 siroheme synthase CysG [Roseicyclus sp. F158]
MRHFPIFVDLAGRRVVLAGGGEAALAKLRLILKTEAHVTVFAAEPAREIEDWAAEGRLRLVRRRQEPGDALCAALFYAGNDDEAEDARGAALARADGARVNMVDNLGGSDFITPAIVDRDPVTVAIGTEGAAPVLARAIKTDLEERLPSRLGLLARIGKAFRPEVEALPFGRARRDFWSDYYFTAGPEAATGGETAIKGALSALLSRHKARAAAPGRVEFVGAGPGDPELLTMKARRALDTADVIIHDRLVSPDILELARREALLISAGKEGFGPSVTQAEIDAAIVAHARAGSRVVRLKAGDPAVFGRLEEEILAVEKAGVDWSVVPGITAASAAAAQIGQSLTARGRNSELRLVTGHDMDGFAENDWHALARPGTVAGIYMGKRAARFLQGRLLMHGADPATPVAIVENASRPECRIVTARLGTLAANLEAASLAGPAVLLLGLAPREAQAAAARIDTRIQQMEHA